MINRNIGETIKESCRYFSVIAINKQIIYCGELENITGEIELRNFRSL
jgi:hypothetical protein